MTSMSIVRPDPFCAGDVGAQQGQASSWGQTVGANLARTGLGAGDAPEAGLMRGVLGNNYYFHETPGMARDVLSIGGVAGDEPTVDTVNGVNVDQFRKNIEALNSLRVDRAASLGESLAPTVENAALLELRSTADATLGDLIGQQADTGFVTYPYRDPRLDLAAPVALPVGGASSSSGNTTYMRAPTLYEEIRNSSVGRTLYGIGSIPSGIYSFGKESLLATSDAIGYSANAVWSTISGSNMPYQPEGAFAKSIGERGWLPTIGDGIRGTVLSLPVIGQINAIQHNNYEELGASFGSLGILGTAGKLGRLGALEDVANRGVFAETANPVSLDFLGRPVSQRTQGILENFQNARSVVVTDDAGRQSSVLIVDGLGKSAVKVNDLGKLQAATGNEFSLLRGPAGDRVLLQGKPNELAIPFSYIDNGYVFSGHSHPFSTVASEADRAVLRAFGQQQSVIKSAATGKQATFTQFEDLSSYLPGRY